MYPKIRLQLYYYGSTGVIGYSNEYDYRGTKILIARVGHNAGYIYMASGQYNVSDNTLILELPSNLNYIFIRALLEKYQLNKLVFGTGQPLITGGLLKKIVIQVPCLEEQTKIANFLSSIDQKIEVVAQQIQQAKQWKKGLLQQMFV
ncbi:restriction endonuclease subunit S [Acinetobacter sp. TGL-Y2]|uniref:restriction endonuclease subunit S n=1 Tax=Acinetobacter sp. TGL-Y2 TaxID=1407071 RepID=UPI003A10170A